MLADESYRTPFVGAVGAVQVPVARPGTIMQSSLTYLIVFIGAGLGGALRHGVNVASLRVFGTGFPFGTLTVNVVGSLAMGLLAGYFALRLETGQIWRLFLTTGVLGGFTTFSTFSLDTALLY